jgi:hypothetical protein
MVYKESAENAALRLAAVASAAKSLGERGKEKKN